MWGKNLIIMLMAQKKRYLILYDFYDVVFLLICFVLLCFTYIIPMNKPILEFSFLIYTFILKKIDITKYMIKFSLIYLNEECQIIYILKHILL